MNDFRESGSHPRAAATSPSPLAQLTERGVSVWFDGISRDRLASGGLAELAADSHVVGVTSNPTIFDRALSSGTGYDDQIRDLATRGVPVEEAARLITGYDIRWACDVLRPAFDQTAGRDGRVSIEVDPRAADDTAKTIAEARALWWQVDRPNAMIKIPATRAGLPAIATATAEGISVNVTLIFGLGRYEAVMDAYLSGLEAALAAGRDLSAIRSVASFFVSRVDTEVDARLDRIGGSEAARVRGRAGVANARLAYQRYRAVIDSPRWKRLAAAGAHVQRPLWASTGVKDAAYPDTLYVDNLIAPDTVNTMPEATLRAVDDHGLISEDTITAHYGDSALVQAGLAEIGVDYTDVVYQLEREGVRKFVDAWTHLLESLQRSMAAHRQQSMQSWS
jgi:transaldolase